MHEQMLIKISQIQQPSQYLIVVHTFQQLSSFAVRIRIISARKAEPDEINDYMNIPH